MLLFCNYNGAASFTSCELWGFSHHNYCHQGRKCYSTQVNVTAAGSIVKSNLLWSENWHRPNPAGWVSGRTRARRRIPYYQLCDINTCLPSLPSQPFIKTAVALRFSLFFFSRWTFTYFLSWAGILLLLTLLFFSFLSSYKALDCQAPHVCQHETKIAKKHKCFMFAWLPHTCHLGTALVAAFHSLWGTSAPHEHLKAVSQASKKSHAWLKITRLIKTNKMHIFNLPLGFLRFMRHTHFRSSSPALQSLRLEIQGIHLSWATHNSCFQKNRKYYKT